MREVENNPGNWRERLDIIGETPERFYYSDRKAGLLAAEWKPESPRVYNQDTFQQNALHFARLIQEHRPQLILVDCTHMGFEVSEQDHLWYVNQTRKLWHTARIKKMAFIFKANLAVQMSMEGLRDVADEQGIPSFNYRIFENMEEGLSWLRS